MQFKKIFCTTSFALGFMFVLSQAPAYASIPSNPTVTSNKDWNVTFSTDINPDTINSSNITVTDDTGNKVNVSISKNNSNSIKVTAPSSGYTAGKAYTLNISGNVKSSNNKSLSNPVAMKFNIQTSSQNYSYGVIKSIDDSNVTVDMGASGEKSFTYNDDDWGRYVETSIVMLDSTGKPVSYDSQNLKQDNIFDFENSQIVFSNLSDKYTLASDAVIVLVSKDGKYIGQGTTADISKAADNESFASALVDTSSNSIKAITIEQQ